MAEDGLPAVMTLAAGDMRKSLNILQVNLLPRIVIAAAILFILTLGLLIVTTVKPGVSDLWVSDHLLLTTVFPCTDSSTQTLWDLVLKATWLERPLLLAPWGGRLNQVLLYH